MLSKGISLPDVPSYMDTATGQQAFEQSNRIVDLKDVGQTALNPYGWLAWSLGSGTEAATEVQTDGNDAATEEKADGSEASIFIHWPLFSLAAYKTAPAAAMTAFKTWNTERLHALAASRGFKERCEVFKAFADATIAPE